jgi:uncharacterized membrane protein required for colicin V production
LVVVLVSVRELGPRVVQWALQAWGGAVPAGVVLGQQLAAVWVEWVEAPWTSTASEAWVAVEVLMQVLVLVQALAMLALVQVQVQLVLVLLALLAGLVEMPIQVPLVMLLAMEHLTLQLQLLLLGAWTGSRLLVADSGSWELAR